MAVKNPMRKSPSPKTDNDAQQSSMDDATFTTAVETVPVTEGGRIEAAYLPIEEVKQVD
jgi:hypothetical protein